MNQQAFEAGKAAYTAGDVQNAIAQLMVAKNPGEVSGAIDHLLGNCFMKQGRFDEAASAYGDALRDTSYGHTGALATNRGRALLAANKPQEAIAALSLATKDESYATPYKAFIALGNANMRIGNVRDAGVAYRTAAIDANNPDPAFALRQLGGCFMQMGRAIDAVEAYRTALDFATPQEDQNTIYGDLGLAYVAANQMGQAVDAFGRALADGTFSLRPEAQAAYDAAKRAVSAIEDGGPSETDAFLQAAGYGSQASLDPLDPTGQSGELVPDPNDTGFFKFTEDQLIELDKQERKQRRKNRHTGLKVFFVLFFLVLILAGGAAFGYYKGYGWPTQETVVTNLFNAGATSDNLDSYFASSVSSDDLTKIKAILPMYVTSNVTIDGVDRSMSSSSVLATASLSNGGTQSYKIDLVRDGISWKVTNVSVTYSSEESSSAATAEGTGTTGTDSTSTTDAADASDTSATQNSEQSDSSSATTTTDGTVSSDSSSN